MKSLIKYLFLVLIIPGVLFCTKRWDNERYPVVGVDSVKEVFIFEDHSEALIHWLKKGYSDEILVNIDEHDDLRFIPEYKIKEIERLYRKKDWDALSRNRDRGVKSLFTLADFIYASFKTGVIRKLYWVSPSGLLNNHNLELTGREFINAFGYKKDEIEDFQIKGKTINLKILGQEVTISSPENLSLSHIKEPVLLSIDLDYITNAMKKRRVGELEVLKTLFQGLKRSDLRVKDITISYSINGGYTEAIYRYIIDEIKEIIKNPDIINSGKWPELWVLRESAFGLLREGRFKEAGEKFSEAIKQFPEDIALKEGKAVTLAMLGYDKDALPMLDISAELNSLGKYLYIYIAEELLDRGKSDKAVSYMERFIKKYPDSYFGLFAYGNILYDSARDEDAFKVYKKILDRYDDVNVAMYAGDTLFHLHRYREATEYYRMGLKWLNDVGYRSLRDFPEAVRNMRYLGVM
jgi:tetratricopeptide (TPR) repeat protein